MGQLAHLGYTITDIRGYLKGKDVMFWGAVGVAFITEDEMEESMDQLLEKASESNPYKHFMHMPLKEQ